MAPCLDLSALFGSDYRITWDEAAGAGRTDPWMQQIPCQRGTIYPHGGELLAVEIDGHNRLADQVAAIPGVIVHQWGDSERTLLFPVGLFEAVAAIVRPRRRRQVTPAQLVNLAKGAAFQFRRGETEVPAIPSRGSSSKPTNGLPAAAGGAG